MQQNDMIEIDLLKILKDLLKKLWLIVLVAAVAGGGMFAWGKASHVPTYTATTTLYASYIMPVDGDASQNSLSEARSIVDTGIAVLNTRRTLDAVAEAAGVDIAAEKLASMVNAAAVNKTEVFTVSVTSTDPQEAALLANAIGQVLPEQVSDVNSNSTVGVIDEALVPAADDGNSIVKDAAVAAVLGAFCVCGVIAVLSVVEQVKAAKKENR